MARRPARPPKQPLRHAVAARMTADRCPSPPHRAHAQQHPRHRRGAVAEAGSGLGRAVRWVKAKPAERVPLPIGVGLYGAGGLAHLAELPALGIIPVTVGTALATYAVTVRRDESRATKAAAAIGAAGTWLAVSAELGPAFGPHAALTWAYCTLYATAYGIYRLDHGTRKAISWRRQKSEWHRLAARLGLGGSHLLSNEPTRLGERLLVDVTGTGRRASSIASSDLAERMAEHYGIPATRVKVSADKIAGRVRISVRHRDPWADPTPHPMLDSDPEIVLPEVADVREPLIIGIDPETGRPLEIVVWDEDGAKHTLIVAVTGGGKSVLLNNKLERLTAADNVAVWGIDVSKAKEMRRWRKAFDLAACGPGDRVKALRMLEQACKIIDFRAANAGDEATFIPRPGHPLIEIVVDEMSALLGPNDNIGLATRQALAYITSKGRSEGVGVTLVGQRGTISQIGDTDIRTQINNIVLLKINRRTEMAHAAGDLGLELPDMTRYGEGHPGVVLIATLDGTHSVGRTFFLKHLPDLDKLAADRRPSPLEPSLVAHLGEAYQRLKADTPAEGRNAQTRPAPAPLDQPEADAVPNTADPIATRMHAAAASREQTRRYLEALPDLPQPDAETAARLAEAAEIRRAQAAEQTEIPDDVRACLLQLLAGDGTTVRQVETALEEMGVSRMGAWRFLDRLRLEGVAVLHGRGRGSRWHLTPEPTHQPDEREGNAA
ncbi:hypothetical protein ABZU32_06850 [Sphaerisporangium sp. NPDC005288]|uniref:hypothetical protein n=1 Tax=Sphaerisporangium sp. NPDC005288 TaxID=3155114 RepID=UPI0033A51082